MLTNEIQTYGWTNVTWNFASFYKTMCSMCFQCMIFMCEMYKLWMNKFCAILIIKLWNVKFCDVGPNLIYIQPFQASTNAIMKYQLSSLIFHHWFGLEIHFLTLLSNQILVHI